MEMAHDCWQWGVHVIIGEGGTVAIVDELEEEES